MIYLILGTHYLVSRAIAYAPPTLEDWQMWIYEKFHQVDKQYVVFGCIRVINTDAVKPV